jgi:2-octaprenyl-6-methoxyphenol hydroxylase
VSEAAPTRVDIAIVGGGMVGASLGLALAGTPLTVMVIEPVLADSAAQPSFDDRSSALGNGSRRVLETLGVWEALAPHAGPVREIQVSDAGHFGAARLVASEQGLEALGYVASNRHIGAALRGGLARCPQLLMRQPGRVVAATVGADAARLELESGERVEARLVVAADGARSLVRDAAGIAASDEDYHQVAIVVHVATDRPATGIAYERFTRTGPLAVLPLPDGHYTVVWTLAPARAEAVLALAAQDFDAELQAAFGWRIGRLLRSGKRASYPLRLSRAELLTGPRTVLVGNAAQALHPVAGQGFNLGLRDAATLAELVATAADPGAPALLESYARRRGSDRSGMIRFTDTLVRGFASERPGMAALRALALAAFDLSPTAKRALARVSWGFGGTTPRLMRGLPVAPGPRG